MISSIFALFQRYLSHYTFFLEHGVSTEKIGDLKGGEKMPDWFTHTLVGWMTGKTMKTDIALVVIGSLIPDLVKINLAFVWLQIDHNYFFAPIHTPIGAFLIGGIIALFFEDAKKAFIPLAIGISTHFILDFFLIHIFGGMKLLFPFSWKEWQYYLIRSDNYWITIIAILGAILVYITYFYHDRRKNPKGFNG